MRRRPTAPGELDVVRRAGAGLGLDLGEAEPEGSARLQGSHQRPDVVCDTAPAGGFERDAGPRPVRRGGAGIGPWPEALSGPGDPDREAWHRASAAGGPDREVVGALELVGCPGTAKSAGTSPHLQRQGEPRPCATTVPDVRSSRLPQDAALGRAAGPDGRRRSSRRRATGLTTRCCSATSPACVVRHRGRPWDRLRRRAGSSWTLRRR